ncbi:(2Fe-2S)-binding protein [Heyndrickxia acidiproducens]|uniref:(2Fe-2S)-binding protein n=1 Tax=Heyndrickxia acidiproducens TaxID=1121084 RepID=UPI0003682810|nr:(2Fe-2S)-binding protein [Heyndrickxia acidiproducens]
MEYEKTAQPVKAGNIRISFELNGVLQTIETDPALRLLDLLREQLQMRGTKISCGIGRCGACSVLLDGHVVNACLVLAYQIDGSHVTTIEGLQIDGEPDLLQQCFLEEGGFQCGYCTPGMIMAAKALLDENPSPSQSEIIEALSGNLCRCTGYGGIIRAVERYKLEKAKKGSVL